MSTISVNPAYGGGYAPRTQINGQQWTEVTPAYGGGLFYDGLIGSFRQVLNVKEWTPAQDDEGVPHGHSVLANIEANNSNLLDIRRDEGIDFNPGTFSDVEVVGNALNLVTSPFTEDWEGVSPLNDWSTRLPTGGGSIYITTDTGSKVLYMIHWNDRQCLTADNGPFTSDVEMRTDVKFNTNDIDGVIGPALRITGSGSANRGYFLELRWNTNRVRFNRITGDGTWASISYHDGPKTIAVGVWYTIMFKASGTGFFYKIWATDTESEPGSWQWIGGSSHHAGPGDIGFFTKSSSANENFHLDNFRAEPVPPVHQTSGYWEGEDDVTSADHYSHGLVSWIEDIPTDTTLVVKIRWPGGTWQTCTNGEILPDIEYEQDMRAGSTKQALEWRVELATTDTSVTPAIEDLRCYFEPARDEEFKVTVHGEEHVIADESLRVWGRSWLSSGSGQPYLEDPDWSDLFMLTGLRWMARDLQTITAAFTYWGHAIDSITFEAEASKYRHGFGTAEWTVPITPFEHGPATWEWTALKTWYPLGHNYEWNIIDKGQAIHADARWICGHIQIDDNPGSFLAGLLVLNDHVGSLIAEGYLLNDFIGQALVQGWRRDDQPGFVLPAQPFLYDTPGSLILSIRELHDQPGMFVVYGVNRDGSIFVNVIDDNTYQTLTDFGVTFS